MTSTIRLGDAAGTPPAGTGSSRHTLTAIKTANYNIAAGDDIIQLSNASASVYATLPTAVGREGKQYTIIKKGAPNSSYGCGVQAAGSETINGNTDIHYLYGEEEQITVVSDGSNWFTTYGEVFETARVWYVGGASGGNGRSARYAFEFFADVIDAAASSDLIYVCGDLVEDCVVDKSVKVAGLGNKPQITGSANTIDSCVFKVAADGVQVENLTIQGPTANCIGTLFMVDSGSRGSYRQLKIQAPAGTTPTSYPTSAGAGSGHGGIGLVANNCEGNRFEDINVEGCSIGFVVGNEASTNQIDRATAINCYQSFVAGLATSSGVGNPVGAGPWAYGGGNGGGWEISNFKATTNTGDATVPHIDLIGDGTGNYVGSDNSGFTFVYADWSEETAGIYTMTCRVGSAANVFIRPTSAPAAFWLIEGQSNVFKGIRILGAGWVVNSDHNDFDGGLNNGCITGAGSYNRFTVRSQASSTTSPLALTGTGNVFVGTHEYYNPDTANVLADLGDSPRFVREEAVKALTYSATVTPDLRLATYFTLPVTNTSAWTLANPIDSGNLSNTANIMLVGEFALAISKTGGGAMGTVTLGSKWKIGSLSGQADNTKTVVKVMFDGTDCVEMSRTTGLPV